MNLNESFHIVNEISRGGRGRRAPRPSNLHDDLVIKNSFSKDDLRILSRTFYRNADFSGKNSSFWFFQIIAILESWAKHKTDDEVKLIEHANKLIKDSGHSLKKHEISKKFENSVRDSIDELKKMGIKSSNVVSSGADLFKKNEEKERDEERNSMIKISLRINISKLNDSLSMYKTSETASYIDEFISKMSKWAKS